ncbi:hypothetical protein CSB37_00795 [bacterium DOLZORAL124_38_8]|nr:MAG: hypothetical protein CSB37_00795 [bacterium DOLZORAL124_38_8]
MKHLVHQRRFTDEKRFLYQFSEGLNAGDSIESQQQKYEELYENVEADAKQGLRELSEVLKPNVSVEITREGGYLYGALWQILHNESYNSTMSFNAVKQSGDKSLLKKQASVLLALKELTADGFDVNTFKSGQSVILKNGKLVVENTPTKKNNPEKKQLNLNSVRRDVRTKYKFEGSLLVNSEGKKFALDHLPKNELTAIYNSMTAQEKAAAFKEGLVEFEKLNQQRQLQFEQFELTNTMMSAM